MCTSDVTSRSTEASINPESHAIIALYRTQRLFMSATCMTEWIISRRKCTAVAGKSTSTARASPAEYRGDRLRKNVDGGGFRDVSR